ncbi:MAG: 8-amino-7-oxononanoate synthase [Planctomycetes bacterium]|nr:8-amino-7-oxononanoate synthase [Planctomycetota bacterium]
MNSSSWDDLLRARLEALKAAGFERRLRTAAVLGASRAADGPATGSGGARLLLDGREIVNFACNDYLGLSSDARVIAAARAALEASGAGATASRLLGGNRPEHVALEADLARFKHSEAALVFASGYQAAIGTITAILDFGFWISDYNSKEEAAGGLDENPKSEIQNPKCILDRLAHASLIDGARLSGARVRTFKHNDVEDLRRLLRLAPGSRLAGDLANGGPPLAGRDARPTDPSGEREASASASSRSSIENRKSKIENGLTLVVVESLYSMDGDVAPLGAIYEATHNAGALLLVDEAHATGVLGPGGRGVLAEVFSGTLPPDVIALGTLSKALGSQGGFVCASRVVVDTIMHAGRAFLFSTGLAPASAAAARKALEIAEAEGARREGLLRRSEELRARLRKQFGEKSGSRGWKVLGGPGPIVPILIGNESEAVRAAERLLEAGVWAPAVRYPTVKKGQARLRVSLSAAHSEEDVAKLVDALAD